MSNLGDVPILIANEILLSLGILHISNAGTPNEFLSMTVWWFSQTNYSSQYKGISLNEGITLKLSHSKYIKWYVNLQRWKVVNYFLYICVNNSYRIDMLAVSNCGYKQ